MALIKCKECGDQVSDKAASCPKCGAPVAKKNKGPSGCMMVLLIFVGVLILLLFIGKVSNKQEAPSQTVSSTQVSNDKLKNNVGKEVEVKKEPVAVINWHNQPTEDSVTGEVGELFYNTSKNYVNFPFPYNVDGGSVLNLVFRKRKQGTDAYVVISKGQIVCGYSDCSIRTKGDNGKVKTWPASSEVSGKSDMIFIDNPQSFEKYIKSNKKITIGVTFYQSGEQGFDFDVSDYPEQTKKK